MAIQQALERRGIHYGWVVVGVTFATLLLTAGAMSMPGLLLVPLQREFGWSNATVSVALSLRMAVFGLMAPFAAAFMLRFGLRAVMVVAVSLSAVGMALTAAVTQSWQLTIVWGFIIGGGTGLTALVLGATVANTWFTERRGVVVGLMTASSASGQLIFLPIFAQIDEILGWKSAVLVVAGVLLSLIPFILLLMRNKPADVGLLAYGEKLALSPAATPAASTENPIAASFRALRIAVRSRNFWVLSFGFMICGSSTNGLIGTHLISACSDVGILPVMAASLLALMGAFDLFGTVASGWLSDRYDNRYLLCIYYTLRGISLIFLPQALGSDLIALSLFAAFYGLDWFAALPPTIKLTTDTFGRNLAALVFGWMFVAHQIGASLAAFAAGWVRTMEATYTPAFVVSGILCIIGGVINLAIRLPSDDSKATKIEPNLNPA